MCDVQGFPSTKEVKLKQEHEAPTNYFWSRAERRRWLVLTGVGGCALYASRVSVPLVVPAMSLEQGWSKSETGTVLSSFFWGYVLTQVIGGNLSDRLGGEQVLVGAAMGWSLCTLAIPSVVRCYPHPASWGLVLLRLLHGAFQGFHYPALSSLSSRRLGELERGPFFSIASSGSSLGAVVAGTAGSALLAHLGWPAVLRFLGCCGLVWAAIVRLCLRSRSCSAEVRPEKQNGVSEVLALHDKKAQPQLHWVSILRSTAFWSAAIAHACQNNCFYIMLSWLPTYFHDANFPGSKDWVFNVVPWLFVIPFTLLGREISEGFLSKGYSVTSTRKIVQSLCFLLQIFGLTMIPFVSDFLSAVVCATLVIAASGFHNNSVSVNPQDLAPKHAGTVFGLMNTVGSIPGFLGVYYVGHILELTQSWPHVFFTTAAINALGCVIFLMYGSGERIV